MTAAGCGYMPPLSWRSESGPVLYRGQCGCGWVCETVRATPAGTRADAEIHRQDTVFKVPRDAECGYLPPLSGRLSGLPCWHGRCACGWVSETAHGSPVGADTTAERHVRLVAASSRNRAPEPGPPGYAALARDLTALAGRLSAAGGPLVLGQAAEHCASVAASINGVVDSAVAAAGGWPHGPFPPSIRVYPGGSEVAGRCACLWASEWVPDGDHAARLAAEHIEEANRASGPGHVPLETWQVDRADQSAGPGNPPSWRYVGRCSCGWRSDWLSEKGSADRAVARHVEQGRADSAATVEAKGSAKMTMHNTEEEPPRKWGPVRPDPHDGRDGPIVIDWANSGMFALDLGPSGPTADTATEALALAAAAEKTFGRRASVSALVQAVRFAGLLISAMPCECPPMGTIACSRCDTLGQIRREPRP